MDDTHRRTFDDYRHKGLAARCGFGARPVLLIVDFINGFTDPSTPKAHRISFSPPAVASCRAGPGDEPGRAIPGVGRGR